MSTLSVDTIQGKTTAGTVQMPSGSVIQVVHHSSSDLFSGNVTGSNITASSNSWVNGDAQSQVIITPKFANSFILLQCVFNTDNETTNGRAMYTFFKSVNGSTFSNVAITNSSGYDSLSRVHDIGERVLIGQEMQFYDAVSSTQEHKYKVYVRGQNSGNVAKIRNDIIPLKLTAMEIAQ